ncbi:hypothetical protein [Brachybacterium sp. GPGPB12]|uniref:hypothetical protein n=1 Tax=Brachybacterium sp. GPGPB12 TaxID=3023517 RepID=UPI003134434F
MPEQSEAIEEVAHGHIEVVRDRLNLAGLPHRLPLELGEEAGLADPDDGREVDGAHAASSRKRSHCSHEVFTRLFADAAAGSPDVMTARDLEQTTAADLARDEVAYYLSCPGERSWWRVAQTHDGEIVGLAIPPPPRPTETWGT